MTKFLYNRLTEGHGDQLLKLKLNLETRMKLFWYRKNLTKTYKFREVIWNFLWT